MCLLLAGTAAAMAILLALWPQLGHDQLWHLLAADRTLIVPAFRHAHHLDPYGPLYFESNPPLALWSAAFSNSVAHALHLPIAFTFKALVLLLAAVSAFFSLALLLELRPTLTRTNLAFLAFAFITIFGAVPARDFGQRDHLLALLILPYIVGAALHAIGNPISYPWRAVFATAAALGIAYKPHLALVPVAVELTVAILRRRPRLIQTAIFLSLGAAYYLAVRLLAPTYLREVVPILRQTYWAFGSLSLPQLLTQSIELDVLAAAAITLYFIQRNRRRSPLTLLLLAAGTAAFAGYLLQGTGWYYQQLPAISLFGLAFAIELIDLAQYYPVPTPAWLPMGTAVLGLLAVCLTVRFSDFAPQPTPDPGFYAGLAPGAAVATLTTTVDDTVPPADTYHLILAQRYPHLWMLPAILRRPNPQLAAVQRKFMVEDLERWHPQLILVNRCQDPQVHCQVLEDRHDNLLEFFLADPRFAAIFSHYHLQKSAGPYDAYALN